MKPMAHKLEMACEMFLSLVKLLCQTDVIQFPLVNCWAVKRTKLFVCPKMMKYVYKESTFSGVHVKFLATMSHHITSMPSRPLHF